MTETETATGTPQAPPPPGESVHYVARCLLQVGRDGDRAVAYGRGAVLPPEIGRQEAAIHPWAVDIRIGHADPDQPGDPNGGSGGAVTHRPEGRTLTEADVAAVAAAMRDDGAALRRQAGIHDAQIGAAAVAERDRVEAEAQRRKGGRH